MTIGQRIVDDARKAVDEKMLFEFNEIPGSVQLVNEVMAGTFYFGFKFVDGPFAGKEIYCRDVGVDSEPVFRYSVDEGSDGMGFNLNSELKTKIENWGGDYAPELDGIMLTVKTDAILELYQDMRKKT